MVLDSNELHMGNTNSVLLSVPGLIAASTSGCDPLTYFLQIDGNIVFVCFLFSVFHFQKEKS